MISQSPANVRIRRAFPNDAPAIVSVLYESFLEYEAIYALKAFRTTSIGIETVFGRMREGPVWVAVLDHAIVGTASTVANKAGLYIRGMAVLPAFRGRGIGRLLMEHIEQYAMAKGFQRMFLSTTPEMSAAIRFYEHFGFELTDQNTATFSASPLLIMQKLLKPADAPGTTD